MTSSSYYAKENYSLRKLKLRFYHGECGYPIIGKKTKTERRTKQNMTNQITGLNHNC